MRRTTLAAAALALLAATPAAPASDTLGFTLLLSSRTPSTATTARLHITFPDGASGKPRPLRHVVVTLPAGTVLDEGAVPECHAGDFELQIEGTAACLASTRLGGGTATAITGFGAPVDPVDLDVAAFHRPGQLVNVYTPHGADRPGMHLSISRLVGASFVEDLTPDPGGPPDGHTTARTLDHLLAPANLPGRSFVTTPPTCPAGGRWVSTLALTFADDGSTQSATAATPCRRRPPRPRPSRSGSGRSSGGRGS